MKIIKNIRIRLFPDKQQSDLLLDTMHTYRKVCNFVASWMKENQCRNSKEIHDSLYYTIREEFGIKSQFVASAIRHVIGTYKSIHATQKVWSVEPKFKVPFLDLVYINNYSFVKGKISISTNSKRVKMTHSALPEICHNGKMGTAQLIFKHGKWILHIAVTIEIPDVTRPQRIAGSDVGVRQIAVTYNSDGKTTFYSGKQVKQVRAKYKRLRISLRRRGTRSARRKLKKIGNKEHRWMTNINHIVSKQILLSEKVPCLFVIEDLSNIRSKLIKVKRKNRYLTVGWAYGQLQTFLEEKAPEYGHTIVTVDPKFTSQTCPRCRYVDKKNRNKSLHIFICKNCNYTSNDDRVAAMNLFCRGNEYLEQLGKSSAFV